MFTDPAHRVELMRDGWKSVRNVFLLAIGMDLVYQITVLKGLRPVQGLLVAVMFAIVPYLLVRGPVNRLARLFGGRRRSSRHRTLTFALPRNLAEPVHEFRPQRQRAGPPRVRCARPRRGTGIGAASQGSVVRHAHSCVVPPVLLVVVAVCQIGLAKTSGLTPWKGGGFGMFSTLDHGAYRGVDVVIEAPDRSEAQNIPPSLEELAARAASVSVRLAAAPACRGYRGARAPLRACR